MSEPCKACLSGHGCIQHCQGCKDREEAGERREWVDCPIHNKLCPVCDLYTCDCPIGGGQVNKREFMMLAKEYEPKHDITGWWMSEKLDGQRAFWDGGVSRGMDAREVPYANVAKDARFVERPIATGLWSRYGKVIHAPDWWLDGLPVGPTLDLELWMGRGTFQEMRSTVGSLTKGDGWRKVRAMALDSPGWHAVLADGEMTGTNWKGFLDRSMLTWVESRWAKRIAEGRANLDFGTVQPWTGGGQPDECFTKTLPSIYASQTREAIRSGGAVPTWEPHVQVKLQGTLQDCRSAVDDMLLVVTSQGGEGLVLRSNTAAWVPKRVPWVLKVKKLSDAEGTVTGFTWGRQTDLGSRHLGRMGALVLKLKNGKRLELSGFTDEERAIQTVEGEQMHGRVPPEALALEGKDASPTWVPAHFPIGSQVTFTYRDLTVDGIPKEARYLRKRTAE